MEILERFLAKVNKLDSGCWEWIGAKWRGYGKFNLGHKIGTMQAHRFSYQQFKAPLTSGLVLDHLCKNTACVNPDHLEEVTQAVNLKRGPGNRYKERTHCTNGHEFTEENTKVREHKPGQFRRDCRTCIKLRSQK